MIKLSVEEIRSIIKPVGLSPKDKRNFWSLKNFIDKYNGKVPKTYEELEALPSVGHKTAAVVMANHLVFQLFLSIHIFIDLCIDGDFQMENVIQTEKDAKRLFPKKLWNKITFTDNLVWKRIFSCKRTKN